MTTGAQRAGAQPEHAIESGNHDDWTVVPMTGDYGAAEQWAESGEPAMPKATRILGAILLLLAVGWLAGSIWVALNAEAAPTPEAAVRWAPVISAPLILFGLLWMILGRSPRRETERFTRAVAAMRTESAALESLLGVVATRLEENHARLTQEAAKLLALSLER